MSFNGYRANIPFVPTGTFTGESFEEAEASSFPLNLNKQLISHPDATFVMRVGTENLNDLGLRKGDIVIIDKAQKPKYDSLVVFFGNGTYGVSLLRTLEKQTTDTTIWGTVTYVIQKRY